MKILNNNKNILNKIFSFLTIIALVASTSTPIAYANHDPFGGVPQSSVKICHKTGNGYVTNSPSVSSTGELQGGHNNHDDIIPPFHYLNSANVVVSSAGKNWNASNEDIWANGNCNGDGIVNLNTLPIISGVSNATIPEMSAYTFTATATDTDLPAQTLTFSLIGAPTGASITAGGVFTWTPTEAQGSGVYSFTVRVSDGTNNVDAPITITVEEVNIAPVATSASVSTAMDTAETITLGANDADLPENTLTYTIVTAPTSGTLGSVSGNQVTYTPNASFVGSDSFTFKVNDGTVDSALATISITVSNDAPVLATIGDTSVDEGTMLSFSASATDPNSDTLTYSLSGAPAGASIDTSTGAFTWTPTEAQGPGEYTMTISVTDGAVTDSQTFTVTVLEVNVAPVAYNQTVTTNEDTPIVITLTSSDVDVPVQTLVYASGFPSNGTPSLIDTSAGTLTYTPNQNYNGVDNFTYKVKDGVLDSNTATVTINVTPVNDAPTITLNGSGEVAIAFGGTFEDPSAICSDVDGGEPTLSTTGTINNEVAGVYTMTYTCTDSGELSASVTRSVTVQTAPALCADNKDNDQDGLKDYPADPGCSSETDNDETDPVVPTPPAGGGGGGAVILFNNPAPQVLGASTDGQVLGASTSCGIYLDDFMKRGWKNNKEQVKKLQTFLNDYLNLKPKLPVTGFFGPQTYKAVVKFQQSESDLVLKPWVGVTLKDATKGTGFVYKTTITRINNIMCPELNIATPAAVLD